MNCIKTLKTKARKVVKTHYLILIMCCALSALIGSEFSASLTTNETTRVVQSYTQKLPGAKKVNKTVEEVKETLSETKNKVKESKSFSKKKGVFSLIVRYVGTNKVYLSLLQLINSITHSKNVSNIILSILSFGFYFTVWFFVINVFRVVIRRIFLESRIYKKVKVERFLFLKHVKKWTKASFTMFRLSLQLLLWYFTIIGGIIKTFSYALVPFIVAENPDISSGDAIKLSRNMMKNHKFELFKLYLSFIGFEVLGILTLNLSKIFFSNAYLIATEGEFYAKIREETIKNKIEGYSYLNDVYLYELASKEILQDKYLDVTNKMKENKADLPERTGFRGFLDRNFGITTYTPKENELVEKEQNRVAVIELYQDIMNQLSYPDALLRNYRKKQDERLLNINYLRHYSVSSLILLFFILSFLGWIWEVVLHLITVGTFINRGVLHGPWLPIYGAGCILILVLLYRFRKRPYKLFIAAILLCGVIEYATSYYLEITNNGMRWWDYTGYFLNINGRVCAEGLLVFGLGGVAIVYFVAPIIDNYIRKINVKYLIPVCTILLSLYLVDKIYSSGHPNTGMGITDYDEIRKSAFSKEVIYL